MEKYLLTDHLGSVVAITSANGSVLSQQRYLPFGQVRTDVGDITQTDFGYTGQRNLADMGLMDYHARMYDSLLGRWIQPDSIVPGASPQALNRYAYVFNSPIGLSDPSGHGGGDDDDDKNAYRLRKLKRGYGHYWDDYKAAWHKGGKLPDLRPQTQAGNSNVGEEGAGTFSQSGLDFTGYSDWEISILQLLYDRGGTSAVHGVEYIVANGIHIKVGSTGDWQHRFNVAGWYEGKAYVVLDPGKNSLGNLPDNWDLSTIIHEAYHIEQGEHLAKSVLGEMQAGQIGLGVYLALNKKFEYGWEQKAYDATTVAEYHAAFEGQTYWWNLFILPCNPGEHILCP